MKTSKLTITDTMTVYGDMPVVTVQDEYSHLYERVNECIKLFLSKAIKPEENSRVSCDKLARWFMLYWKTQVKQNEELKRIPDSVVQQAFKRYIMNYCKWANLHSRMWLAHVREKPGMSVSRYRRYALTSSFTAKPPYNDLCVPAH